jgi:hypothetical protein
MGAPGEIRLCLDAGWRQLDTYLNDSFRQSARTWALPSNRSFARHHSKFRFNRKND